LEKVKRYSLYLLIALSAIMLAACSSASADEDNLISFGAHQPGIAYHSAASGIANVVTDQSDLKVTVLPFSGPNAWMPLLNEGEIDVGILSYPDAGWAFTGENGFPKENKNIRMLVNGNKIVTSGLTIRVDSGIEKVSDLEGKRVASDYTGNKILHKIAEAHLASAGLTWDDVKPMPVSDVGSGLNALREGRVDAVFTGTPTVGTFNEMDTTTDIDALNWGEVEPEDIDNFPEETKEKMKELVPGIAPTVTDGGILNGERTVINYPIILAGNTYLSDDAAYELVKTLWNHYEKLHPQYIWLETWEPERMFDEDPAIPYHPGAVKFFKEVGVWTKEAEQNQNELLNEIN